MFKYTFSKKSVHAKICNFFSAKKSRVSFSFNWNEHNKKEQNSTILGVRLPGVNNFVAFENQVIFFPIKQN